MHVPPDQAPKPAEARRRKPSGKLKPPQRFAQGTEVEVGKTRGEIETLLQRHGADQCLTGSDFKTHAGFVHFALGNRQIRFKLRAYAPNYREHGGGKPLAPEQYEREQWRALLLIIKAKLESVRSGVVTVEQEFLANIVLPNGVLLGDEIAPRVAEMYESGQVRALLGSGD